MLKKAFFIFFMTLPLFVFPKSRSEKIKEAFEVIENGSASEIKKAVENDFSFVKYKRDGNQDVLMAALEKSRESEIINILLESGASPNSKDKNGKTPLMYACQYENDMNSIINVLKYNAFLGFQKKNRILKKDKNGKNCFDYAMENPNKDEVIAILSKYAKNPNKNANLNNEKEENLESENQNISEEILKNENSTNEIPDKNFEKDKISAEIPFEESETKTEEEKPKENEQNSKNALKTDETQSQEISDEKNQTFLKNEAQETNKLIEFDKMEKISPSKESIYLYDYAKNSSESNEIPQNLLKDSKNFSFIDNANEKNSNGMTLLMEASKQGDVEKIRNLIYSGADVSTRDKNGRTALMYAVRHQENNDAVKILIANGASPFTKNNFGENAIMIATGYAKNPEIVKTLINPLKAESEELREAFVYGIKKSASTEILKLFIEKKLALNIPYEGKTYLMYAAKSNSDTNIIKLLLDSGASKNQVEYNTGKTAFDYARENSQLAHDSVYWSLRVN